MFNFQASEERRRNLNRGQCDNKNGHDGIVNSNKGDNDGCDHGGNGNGYCGNDVAGMIILQLTDHPGMRTKSNNWVVVRGWLIVVEGILVVEGLEVV